MSGNGPLFLSVFLCLSWPIFLCVITVSRLLVFFVANLRLMPPGVATWTRGRRWPIASRFRILGRKTPNRPTGAQKREWTRFN